MNLDVICYSRTYRRGNSNYSSLTATSFKAIGPKFNKAKEVEIRCVFGAGGRGRGGSIESSSRVRQEINRKHEQKVAKTTK